MTVSLYNLLETFGSPPLSGKDVELSEQGVEDKEMYERHCVHLWESSVSKFEFLGAFSGTQNQFRLHRHRFTSPSPPPPTPTYSCLARCWKRPSPPLSFIPPPPPNSRLSSVDHLDSLLSGSFSFSLVS